MPNSLRKQSAQRDLVPVFCAGSPQTSEPDLLLERQLVRQWKKEGKGYFADHGRVFQLIGAIQSPKADWDQVLRAFGVRGESTKIDEPAASRELGMMSRYVIGETRAVAAVESYRNGR